MPTRYKVSKFVLFLLTAGLLLVFLPLSLTPIIFISKMTLETWIEWLPIYPITFCYSFLVLSIFRYALKDFVFEIRDGAVRFVDGSVALDLTHVDSIKLIYGFSRSSRAVHFEMKPEYRKARFKFFPFLGSYGGKYAGLGFGSIAGGWKALEQFYEDVCKEHQKYNS